MKDKVINNALVPKLRFPEFRDEGEWNIELFEELYSFKPTNSFSRDNLNYNTGTVKNIHYGDIHTKFSTLFYLNEEAVPYVNISLSIEKINPENYCKEGDMIFADASEDLDGIGKSIEIIKLDDEKLLSGLHTLLARQKTNKLTIGFGGYLFSSDGIRRQVQKEAQGAKVFGISNRRLSNIYVYYPQNKIEQQKIADCLSSIDDLIVAQSQTLEALKTHKKGLMQQLFPAEGETVPKLRFPEFRDEGEWEVKMLRDICTINPSCNTLPESFVYIDLESVVAGKLTSKTKIYGSNAPSRAQRLLENEDVIYQTVRPYQKNNFFCLFEDETPYVASSGYAQLRAKECSKFLYQIVHTKDFVNNVIAKCTGSNYPAINSSDLATIRVSIPKLLAEQQKIADCLSSMDDLIETQTQKLEAFKTHKRGLMQQLFPNPNPTNKWITNQK